jgi:membrane protein implicated in regulation of membrane protease activity
MERSAKTYQPDLGPGLSAVRPPCISALGARLTGSPRLGIVIAEGVLDLGIDLNVWPWVWLIVAVLFALIELTVLGGSFVLLPFAVSAFAASILGFYEVAIEIQWGVFLFGGAALFAAAIRWLRRFVDDHDTPPGVGADRLVGMTGIVTETISHNDVTRHGRVNIAGEIWGALPIGARTIEPGTHVRITMVQGTRVIVEPVQNDVVTTPEEPT